MENMNQIQMFTNEIFGNVRATVIDDNVWMVGKDVATALGYTNPNKALKDHCREEGVAFCYTPTGGGKQQLKYINAGNVIRLVEKSKTVTESTKVDFLKFLNLDKDKAIIISSRKEIEFLDTLEAQLKVFDITNFKHQYSNMQCGDYRIDLYIPELNVAIEYDENSHKHYTYEQQEIRQQLIEEELGCRFIRVSDDKSHVENSAIVLRELMKLNLLK